MGLKHWAVVAFSGLISTGVLLGCTGTLHSLDAKDNGHQQTEHEQTNSPMTGSHSGMHHGSLTIPVGQPQPTLKLKLEPDAMGGWNLHAEVHNFAFAPERVNQSSLTREGHAHLFINGEKTTRLYSPWYYIPALPPGEHEIRVELNANGHEVLIYDGSPIQDTVTLTVPITP